MPRTIKKYANRRLYDTAISRHVTVAGIRQLVAAGEDVVIVDDTTGRDITRNILLQVIVEAEQGLYPVLSTKLMKQIIRSYDDPALGGMGDCLERRLEDFLRESKSLPLPVPMQEVTADPSFGGLPGALAAKAADEHD